MNKDRKIAWEIRIEFVDGNRVTIGEVRDSGFEENGRLFWVSHETFDRTTGYVDYFPTAQIVRIQDVFYNLEDTRKESQSGRSISLSNDPVN